MPIVVLQDVQVRRSVSCEVWEVCQLWFTDIPKIVMCTIESDKNVA